jgi:MIP family channel proteins
MPVKSPLTPFIQKLTAEFIGTFALVFVGCGAIVVASGYEPALGHGGVCAAFGLVIMVMINATGHISGAHFNPAVTFAFAVAGRFRWKEVPGYWMAQVGGAVLAATLLQLVLGDNASLGATIPREDLLWWKALLIETIFTFFLMFVIISVATDSRAVGPLAGLAIGGTVALAALVAGPLTGASMNPARSLGPALVSGTWTDFWLYLVGPFGGATLGALIYELIRCDTGEEGDAQGCC